MITFIISLIALVVGFVLYGTFVERVFGIDEKAQTPAVTMTDGVDFVPMKPWRIFLVQFLNIAGLGPIFGAIMNTYCFLKFFSHYITYKKTALPYQCSADFLLFSLIFRHKKSLLHFHMF